MLEKFLTAGRVRLALALIVLLHHTLGFFAFGATAVYLFFALSGYWISRLWDSKYSVSRYAIFRFYLSRWLRLAPILACVLLIAIGVSILFPAVYSLESHHSLFDLKWWLTTLGIVGIAHQHMVISPAWSLAVEMQFYLVFPLLAWAIQRTSITFGALLALSTLYGVLRLYSGAPAILGDVFVFLPYFLLGIAYHQWPIRLGSTWIWAAAGLFFAIAVLLAANPSTRFIINNYPGKSSSMIIIQNLWFYGGTFLLVPLVLMSVNRPSSRFDRLLGNLAYPLYLFHMIPVALYYYYRDQIDLPKSILLLICWLLCGVGTLIIYWAVDRPAESIRKLLTDTKSRKNHDRENQKSLPNLGAP